MSRHIVNPQVVSTFFNRTVKTPIGSGVAFGVFRLKDRNEESIGERIVVSLPVDEMTRPHLNAAHCLTPHANEQALFTFDAADVEA